MADKNNRKQGVSDNLSKEDREEQLRAFEEAFRDPRGYRDRRHDDHHESATIPGCRRKYRRRATYDRYGETWWLKRRYNGQPPP